MKCRLEKGWRTGFLFQAGPLDRNTLGSTLNWSQTSKVALGANMCAIDGSGCTDGRILRTIPAVSTSGANLAAHHFPGIHDLFWIKDVLNCAHEMAFDRISIILVKPQFVLAQSILCAE